MSKIIHDGQPLLTYGASLHDAAKAVILLHGRGASAHDILPIAQQLPHEEVCYLAPQAAENRWYPNSGFIDLAENEPDLSSAMIVINRLVDKIVAAGISTEKIFIGGFSQGACLASEYVAQHAKRYGGVFVLSGAIMGTMDRDHQFDGSLDGTRVFIGGVDNDSWVKPPQFELTRDVLTKLGGIVTLQILAGSEHTIRDNELENVYNIIKG